MSNRIGSYELIRLIGEGGMGKVYLAHHLHTGGFAVVKALLPQYAQNEQIVQRFHAEARLLAQLRHPAIVTLYDFYIQDGVPYLIMEYVEGESLDSLLQRTPEALGWEWAVNHLKPILEALEYVHSRGIIHRDIKPSNIILSTEGKAKLLDFGIAKVLDQDLHLTQTGHQVGTALYMAPEQIRGLPVSPQTDLYAMGIILYQCLLGKYPWEWRDKNQFQIYEMLLKEPAPLPRFLPPSWRLFFERALAKDPSERFNSAKEMQESLVQLQRADSSFDKSPSLSDTKATSSLEQTSSPPPAVRKISPFWRETLLMAGAFLTAALLYPPLGILGFVTWGGATYTALKAFFLSGKKKRIALLSSGFILCLLGYFYLYAWPTAKKAYEKEQMIFSALEAELYRYQTTYKESSTQQNATLTIESLPVPEGIMSRNLSPQEVLMVLFLRAPVLYQEEGSLTQRAEVHRVRLRRGAPFRKEVECTVRCGFLGLRTCYGYQEVWYVPTWEEDCLSKGVVHIQYEYNPEEEKFTFFHVELPESWETHCTKKEGTERHLIEYVSPCSY
ncbi:MAG: serine/threonine protein kinase [Bacteroidia bacterium]|nr:serine/threonine protein kinase [Bacteroidia bacterium]